jgi:predicted TIM-barrel enzyme
MGVNVLANAALHALAVDSASGARFVRINQWANAYIANEGLIEGAAAQASRHRSEIGAQDVRIFADVHVKHGAHAIVQDRPIAELVRDVEFFNADVVIATGQRTGHTADLDYLKTVRAARSILSKAFAAEFGLSQVSLRPRTAGCERAPAFQYRAGNGKSPSI